MIALLAALMFANLVLSLLIALRVKKKKQDPVLEVEYFDEVLIKRKFFVKVEVITKKAQLLYNKIPVGSSYLVKEDRFVTVDKEQINRTLSDLVKPTLQIGLKLLKYI